MANPHATMLVALIAVATHATALRPGVRCARRSCSRQEVREPTLRAGARPPAARSALTSCEICAAALAHVARATEVARRRACAQCVISPLRLPAESLRLASNPRRWVQKIPDFRPGLRAEIQKCHVTVSHSQRAAPTAFSDAPYATRNRRTNFFVVGFSLRLPARFDGIEDT
jgi:hypothetical protein